MRTLAFLIALTLSACGSPNDPGAGGVTKGEADALNAAAAKLDTPPPGPVLENQAAAQ